MITFGLVIRIFMYKRILFALVLVGLHLHVMAQMVAIDSIVQDEMHKQHIVGLSLGIMNNGRVMVKKGYGFADLKDSVPASENTVYRIGSLSKQFIATAILQLEEQGKLNLADRIPKYFKDAPATWAHISIRNLLNHTSGLERESPVLTETSLLKKYPDSFVIQAAYYDTLSYATGSKWLYSNLGYFILADIIRKVSGQTFADYMNHFFSVCGLKNTTTTDKTSPDTRAMGYNFHEKTDENAEVKDLAVLRPSGAFSSNIADLLKWDEIQKENKLLSSQDWNRMHEDSVMAIAADDDTLYYGYGWEVLKLNKHRLVKHGGNPYGGGFTSSYLKFTDDKISIILIANATAADLDKIAYKIAGTLNPELKEEVTKVANADSYTGVYANASLKMKITVMNDENELTAQATGQPSFPLKYIGNDKFKYSPAGIEMDFYPKLNKFLLKQHGLDYVFIKEK